ncbi:hypothetical protein BDP27DRAFT_1332509 [Rhodocollybia butyracea]|uniref:Uncharacterized protein n=1 Tax=Rhodocollybia butyracea TaxID=206335 RepID=A0A9P5U2W8_9AGAR|nr:hypothetical protein BDP27DRAFT_1332509 [Rhodocollybia butyracea]
MVLRRKRCTMHYELLFVSKLSFIQRRRPHLQFSYHLCPTQTVFLVLQCLRQPFLELSQAS